MVTSPPPVASPYSNSKTLGGGGGVSAELLRNQYRLASLHVPRPGAAVTPPAAACDVPVAAHPPTVDAWCSRFESWAWAQQELVNTSLGVKQGIFRDAVRTANSRAGRPSPTHTPAPPSRAFLTPTSPSPASQTADSAARAVQASDAAGTEPLLGINSSSSGGSSGVTTPPRPTAAVDPATSVEIPPPPPSSPARVHGARGASVASTSPRQASTTQPGVQADDSSAPVPPESAARTEQRTSEAEQHLLRALRALGIAPGAPAAAPAPADIRTARAAPEVEGHLLSALAALGIDPASLLCAGGAVGVAENEAAGHLRSALEALGISGAVGAVQTPRIPAAPQPSAAELDVPAPAPAGRSTSVSSAPARSPSTSPRLHMSVPSTRTMLSCARDAPIPPTQYCSLASAVGTAAVGVTGPADPTPAARGGAPHHGGPSLHETDKQLVLPAADTAGTARQQQLDDLAHHVAEREQRVALQEVQYTEQQVLLAEREASLRDYSQRQRDLEEQARVAAEREKELELALREEQMKKLEEQARELAVREEVLAQQLHAEGGARDEAIVQREEELSAREEEQRQRLEQQARALAQREQELAAREQQQRELQEKARAVAEREQRIFEREQQQQRAAEEQQQQRELEEKARAILEREQVLAQREQQQQREMEEQAARAKEDHQRELEAQARLLSTREEQLAEREEQVRELTRQERAALDRERAALELRVQALEREAREGAAVSAEQTALKGRLADVAAQESRLRAGEAELAEGLRALERDRATLTVQAAEIAESPKRIAEAEAELEQQFEVLRQREALTMQLERRVEQQAQELRAQAQQVLARPPAALSPLVQSQHALGETARALAEWEERLRRKDHDVAMRERDVQLWERGGVRDALSPPAAADDSAKLRALCEWEAELAAKEQQLLEREAAPAFASSPREWLQKLQVVAAREDKCAAREEQCGVRESQCSAREEQCAALEDRCAAREAAIEVEASAMADERAMLTRDHNAAAAALADAQDLRHKLEDIEVREEQVRAQEAVVRQRLDELQSASAAESVHTERLAAVTAREERVAAQERALEGERARFEHEKEDFVAEQKTAGDLAALDARSGSGGGSAGTGSVAVQYLRACLVEVAAREARVRAREYELCVLQRQHERAFEARQEEMEKEALGVAKERAAVAVERDLLAAVQKAGGVQSNAASIFLSERFKDVATREARLSAREVEVSMRMREVERSTAKLQQYEIDKANLDADISKVESLEVAVNEKQARIAKLEQEAFVQSLDLQAARERLVFEYAELAEREAGSEAKTKAASDAWNSACVQQATTTMQASVLLSHLTAAAAVHYANIEVCDEHATAVTQAFTEAAAAEVATRAVARGRVAARVTVTPAPSVVGSHVSGTGSPQRSRSPSTYASPRSHRPPSRPCFNGLLSPGRRGPLVQHPLPIAGTGRAPDDAEGLWASGPERSSTPLAAHMRRCGGPARRGSLLSPGTSHRPAVDDAYDAPTVHSSVDATAPLAPYPATLPQQAVALAYAPDHASIADTAAHTMPPHGSVARAETVAAADSVWGALPRDAASVLRPAQQFGDAGMPLGEYTDAHGAVRLPGPGATLPVQVASTHVPDLPRASRCMSPDRPLDDTEDGTWRAQSSVAQLRGVLPAQLAAARVMPLTSPSVTRGAGVLGGAGVTSSPGAVTPGHSGRVLGGMTSPPAKKVSPTAVMAERLLRLAVSAADGTSAAHAAANPHGTLGGDDVRAPLMSPPKHAGAGAGDPSDPIAAVAVAAAAAPPPLPEAPRQHLGVIGGMPSPSQSQRTDAMLPVAVPSMAAVPAGLPPPVDTPYGTRIREKLKAQHTKTSYEARLRELIRERTEGIADTADGYTTGALPREASDSYVSQPSNATSYRPASAFRPLQSPRLSAAARPLSPSVTTTGSGVARAVVAHAPDDEAVNTSVDNVMRQIREMEDFLSTIPGQR